MDLQRAYTMVQATRKTMPHADCVLCALSDTVTKERVILAFGLDAVLLIRYRPLPLHRVTIGNEVTAMVTLPFLEAKGLLHAIVGDNKIVAIAEDYDGEPENWPDEIEVKI